MKNVLRYILKMLPARWRQYMLFLWHVGYFPNFKRPETYNEKVCLRKLDWQNELFISCSDKVAAKDFVRNVLGDEFIIENYYVGTSISPALVKETIKNKGGVVLKANHNSGPVFLLDESSTDDEIAFACRSILRQLKLDFGRYNDEGWYRKIPRKVLMEKRLYPENDESAIRDYKFHVFSRGNGKDPVVLMHVHFDRFGNHTMSYFDEDLNYLPFSRGVPSIYTSLGDEPNYQIMLEAAKKLGKPFSYARIDFYSIGDKVYFGELTFAPGSGLGSFSDRGYDLWMGRLWTEDPRF